MLEEVLIYEVGELHSAREFLNNYRKPVIITNKDGSTKYYGMLVIDYIFKHLIEEFPHIVKVIINVSDDNVALFTSIKLNYKNIIYNGKSKTAKRMILDRI